MPSTALAPPSDIDAIRAHFPALSSPTAFLDNAGGSQMSGVVIDAISAYMRESYVQLGADYAESRRATAVVAAAHRFQKFFMGVERTLKPSGTEHWGGEVIIGSSTSQLMYTLANAYGEVLQPGDEIIISEASHESNAGCWERLRRFGINVKMWHVDQATFRHSARELEALMGPRTRLVCFPHVSNILGEVMDVAALTKLVHAAGARVVVDGVAFAPHRAMEVGAWNVDWYVYSTYKVFGPHMAALYGRRDAMSQLTGPNHFFIPKDEVPRKFELGGVSHEGAAGLVALDHFLRDLSGTARLPDVIDPHAAFDRRVVTRAFEIIESLETPLQERLIAFLQSQKNIRVIGPPVITPDRVCIVSFVVPGRSSKTIVQAASALGLGFRYGNFYAYRLCTALGLDPVDGVVRVSFCHYNTTDEVDRVIEFIRRTIERSPSAATDLQKT